MEMEALGAGVLRKILVQAGGKAPIGALIGVDRRRRTRTSRPCSPRPRRPAPRPGRRRLLAPAAPAAARAPRLRPHGRARRQPASAAPRSAARSARRPRPPPAPAPAAASRRGEGGRVKASPLARSIAARAEHPARVGGRQRPRRPHRQARRRGPGRARARAPRPRARVRAVAASRRRPVTLGHARPGAPALEHAQDDRASGSPRASSRRPHFYVTVEIDMDAAVDLREQILTARGGARSPSTTSW